MTGANTVGYEKEKGKKGTTRCLSSNVDTMPYP